MKERGSTMLRRGGQRQEWMETMTVLSRVVQTLLLGLFLPVPVQNGVQVGTPFHTVRWTSFQFNKEDVHQTVVIHELSSRPQQFLSPDATSLRPSVSADRMMEIQATNNRGITRVFSP